VAVLNRSDRSGMKNVWVASTSGSRRPISGDENAKGIPKPTEVTHRTTIAGVRSVREGKSLPSHLERKKKKVLKGNAWRGEGGISRGGPRFFRIGGAQQARNSMWGARGTTGRLLSPGDGRRQLGQYIQDTQPGNLDARGKKGKTQGRKHYRKVPGLNNKQHRQER